MLLTFGMVSIEPTYCSLGVGFDCCRTHFVNDFHAFLQRIASSIFDVQGVIVSPRFGKMMPIDCRTVFQDNRVELAN